MIRCSNCKVTSKLVEVRVRPAADFADQTLVASSFLCTVCLLNLIRKINSQLDSYRVAVTIDLLTQAGAETTSPAPSAALPGSAQRPAG